MVQYMLHMQRSQVHSSAYLGRTWGDPLYNPEELLQSAEQLNGLTQKKVATYLKGVL